MKSGKARELVEAMEVDYNARNKMINSTVAHQAVQLAEEELTQKAIEAYKKSCDFNAPGCCACKNAKGECDCEQLKDFIAELE